MPDLTANSFTSASRMWRKSVPAAVLFGLALEGVCFAQQPLCIPGTRLCSGTNGQGAVQAGGSVRGRVDPAGASVNGNTSANANGNANANASGNVNTSGNASVNGTSTGRGHGHTGSLGRPRRRPYSEPIRFGAGLLLCGTSKVGVYSGVKGGPCFAVSFRTERLTFEIETQLLFGGARHSTDWVFPMSFVIPITSQRSLYEGLQLRVGGSPIGVTFARVHDGGTYLRFGLHAGVSYEWGVSEFLTWRLFDFRTFLDFGTKREVDLRGNFLDVGGQLSTGIVF